MSNLVNLEGRKFGRLSVVSKAMTSKRFAYWVCECDCGSFSTVRGTHLRNGKIQSCGCLNRDLCIQRHTTHGMTRTRTWNSWRDMKQRCLNPNYIEFHLYGGRGVTICKRWLESFANFLADMGERPHGKTLDRVNPNDCYCPENCRWADGHTQRINRRKS